MGAGPIPAAARPWQRRAWAWQDIEAIELNEAFAAQALFVIRRGGWPAERVNLHGGAIALGHPLGASGARILCTLLAVMEHRDLHTGLAALCIGGGQGIATIVQRPRHG
jgi:acetyl-CoA acetyltransferase